MSVKENYAEVFGRFPYETVTNGEYIIRRYRGVVYTKWRNGKFVEFVYAIDGAALFESSESNITRSVYDVNETVPYYRYAFATHMVDVFNIQRDPDGDRVLCYVDKFRGTEEYDFQKKDKHDIYQTRLHGIQKNELHSTMMSRNDGHYIRYSDHEIQQDKKKIDDFYRPYLTVEYKYLHQQLQQIQTNRDNGITCKLTDSRLKTLENKLKKRFEELGRAYSETELTGLLNNMSPADMITRQLAEMKKLVE